MNDSQKLLLAALNCAHVINAQRIVLEFEPEKVGHNATNQLSRRLDAFLDDFRKEGGLAEPTSAREARAWIAKGRAWLEANGRSEFETLADPRMRDEMDDLKRRIKEDPEVGARLMREAGIWDAENRLTPKFIGGFIAHPENAPPKLVWPPVDDTEGGAT